MIDESVTLLTRILQGVRCLCSEAKIDEKNRLYDRITREVAVQLKKAEGLIQQAERNPAEAEGIFAEVCVLNAYICNNC